MPNINIPADTMSRIEALARPFKDHDANDVLTRVLDLYEKHTRAQLPVPPVSQKVRFSPKSRVPRERGATVEIDRHTIKAIDVRDLFEQTLTYLRSKHAHELKKLVPFQTSHARFFISYDPKHPNGNPFFIPVQCGEFFVEANKSYATAIANLGELARRMGLEFKYLG